MIFKSSTFDWVADVPLADVLKVKIWDTMGAWYHVGIQLVDGGKINLEFGHDQAGERSAYLTIANSLLSRNGGTEQFK